MTRAYIGLGANLGDREATIRAALAALADEDGIEVVAFTCRDCGYVRLHNLHAPGRLSPPDLGKRLQEMLRRDSGED